jgi:ATP-dependent exoDNAse (exonuclease V) beta subunit
MRRRAVELVRTALANESVRTAFSVSHWREVPFAKVEPAGVVEGAIDIVADEPHGVAVLDFKTDVVTSEEAEELERLYSVQLSKYLDVARSVTSKPTNGKLVLLPRPGGVQSHT